jgi:hypothetical protein
VEIPARRSVVTDETVAFAVSVIDSCDEVARAEERLGHRLGRRRSLSVRALMVALFVLGIDDRPLLLTEATRLLYSGLSEHWREELGVTGGTETDKQFAARYCCVRYLFHAMTAAMDPSVEAKNRVMPIQEHAKLRKSLSCDEVAGREAALARFVSSLIESSVRVCDDSELEGFDGSLGLDATPVPLWSRGPSGRRGLSASDPDGGWYVREGDHRDHEGPDGRKRAKVFFALEATLAVMGQVQSGDPSHPNLVLAMSLDRPGADPGGSAVALLFDIKARGWRQGLLAADRGYSQVRPEKFHLPVRALGYSVVIDYKSTELGRQGESGGALMVDGAFYCPAMPEALVNAGSDYRSGRISERTHDARIAARDRWRLKRKQGPDTHGYERYSCPALAPNSGLSCPLRPSSAGLARIPVASPPKLAPKICTQSAVTIAPDIGARFRQDLPYGSERWRSAYATWRNTIEGTNGYLKDTAHESLAAPGRRRVRGKAAQSVLCALLVMAGNIRKIQAFRSRRRAGEGVNATRRRTSLSDYHPRA